MMTKLSLVLAVILGFAAAIGVKAWMEKEQTKLRLEHQPQLILVANKAIRKGEVIRASMLSSREFPQKFIVAGMIPHNDMRRHLGKIATVDIRPQMPIFETFLETKVDRPQSTVSLIGEGRRAVTMRVDQVSGVAGLIRPGDYVDVVATFRLPSTSPTSAGGTSSSSMGEVRTLYLLQAARVIALDNRTLSVAMREGTTEQPYRTVTFDLTPRDALRLIDALNRGATIQLLLRQRGEVKIEPGTDEASRRPTLHWNVLEEIQQTRSYLSK